MTMPVFYGRLAAEGSTLKVQPALAIWDKGGSPGQTRWTAFVDDMHSVLADRVGAHSHPFALRLEVGLPDIVPLTTMNDLDNYAFPLVPTLTARTGRPFASVWASKRHAGFSSVAVGPAVPADDPGGTYAIQVRTTASASTSLYKEQIRDQISAAGPLPGDAVALQLAFVVGPRRSWPNLWKATIDSLGSILGHDEGASQWNARDGRITDLGLHCVTDPGADNKVTIAIRASAI